MPRLSALVSLAGTQFFTCLTGLACFMPIPTRAEEAPVQAVPAIPQNPAAMNADLTTLYEERSVSIAEGNETVEFRYRLLRPASVAGDERDGRRYPLVLFLHGAGERGNDNLKQLKYLPTWLADPALRQRHPCFVLAPQCRMDERWVDVSWADEKSTPQPITPTVDLAAARRSIPPASTSPDSRWVATAPGIWRHGCPTASPPSCRFAAAAMIALPAALPHCRSGVSMATPIRLCRSIGREP
jgi:hypothetical protein